MEITFSANNREEIMVLPLMPNDIDITRAQDNSTYDGLSFPLNLIGNLQLREFQLESIFPNKKYSWAHPLSSSNANDYIEFFEKWRNKKVPIRVVMTNKQGGEILNMPCTIDSFNYHYDRAGDVAYSMTVREYRFVEV